ncbi:hypothetical protein [Exiguobacterium artemiae]|uniref:hypothetical protein n=1 Tax=Exiguobacterium artemiae TaxID=340145 RepID=UPI0029647210|nr:hypothetical protein [Exiguobacterium sibiricum]MDW2884673.1 hypothetical protein [Exiguobacterium sibiricum]
MNNEYFQVEQFSISYIWLAVILAFLLLAGLGWLSFRHLPREWLLNSFMLYILIWKGSYALFHLSLVLDMPGSLLFFHGGYRGQLLAVGGLLIYWLKVMKYETAKFLPYFSISYLLQFEFVLAILYGRPLLLMMYLTLSFILISYQYWSFIPFEWLIVAFLLHLCIQSIFSVIDWKAISFQILLVGTSFVVTQLKQSKGAYDAST